MRRSAWLFAAAVLVFATINLGLAYVLSNATGPRPATAGPSYVNWRIFDGGADDPGTNYSESYLTTGNASGLKVFWHANLPASADNSVVEEAAVSTSSGIKNLVFVNTIKGNLIAYDALSGTKIWEADPSSSNFNGQGTKSTPAIDPSGGYIYSYALDGYIHRYNIGTGAEVSGTGFPAQATLLPNDTEKASASINIAGGYLYLTMSGNDGDYGHYDGHVVAVNLSSGAKTVWNAECSNITSLLTSNSGAGNYCSNVMSGMWARPGVKQDPVTGNVYAVAGNGNYNASTGGNNWGDSIIELTPNLSSVVDSYTPATYASLDSADADLGSTAPVILPKQSSSNTPYMMVQGGKDHILRLLNRSNLSGAGGPRHTGGELQTITISNETHEQPAVWVDSSGTSWVFVTDDSGDLYAYKVITTSGTTHLVQQYTEYIGASSSPFVANGVLYLSAGHLLALNATTGAQLFSSSGLGVSLNQHWEAPVVVNGLVITPDYNGGLYAFYVPGITPTTPPTATTTSSGGTTASTPNSSIPKPAAVTSSAPKATPSPTPSPTPTISASPTPSPKSNPITNSLRSLVGMGSKGSGGLSGKLVAVLAAGSALTLGVIVFIGLKVFAAHQAAAATLGEPAAINAITQAWRRILDLFRRGTPT